MPGGMDADGLRREFRRALRDRLAPAGWQMQDTATDSRSGLVVMRRVLNEQCAATSEVSQSTRISDRPPIVVSHVRVGVSFEPLRRLAPLLNLYEVDVLGRWVWPAGENPDPRAYPWSEISTAQDAERAADEIARIISERAVAYAERHASLDALLEAFPSGDRGVRPRLTRAALLAVTDRFDDARSELERGRASPHPAADRGARRAAYQLGRWIDSGGDPSLIPVCSPPDPLAARPMPSASEIRADGRAQQAAIAEIKQTAAGAPREAAADMLRAALVRHGAREQSPLRIETQLDHLWDIREDKIVHTLQGLRSIARAGLGVARAFRDQEFPDPSPPAWLEPPADALYEIPRSDQWTRVQLLADTDPFLGTVYDACRQMFGSVRFTAWLADHTLSEQIILDVVIAARAIGTVPDADVADFADVIADANSRAEHPCLNARLSRHADAYLLELEKPFASA